MNNEELDLSKEDDKERASLSPHQLKIRECEEEVFEDFINTTLRKEWKDLKWKDCGIAISDSYINYVIEMSGYCEGYYDSGHEPPFIVLPSQWKIWNFFHEVVHHMQYLRAHTYHNGDLTKVFIMHDKQGNLIPHSKRPHENEARKHYLHLTGKYSETVMNQITKCLENI